MLANKTQIADFQDWTKNPFWKAVRYRWYWFLISPLLSVLLGFTFLRYKTPHYTITASLLVRDDSRGSDFHETALLEELGLPDATSSVENEIEILKSRTLLSQIISDLHLTTQYFAAGTLKTTELYDKTPYKVRFLKSRPAKPESYLIIRETDSTFRLQTSDHYYKGSFGKKLSLPHGAAIMDTTRFKPSSHYQYSFKISATETILDHYDRVLRIQAPNKAASLVNLSIQDVLPRKGEAILNQLIERYQKASIQEKNKVADNTIAFINSNLTHISSELTQVETNIEQFRKRHRVIDMAEDGRQALQQYHSNASDEKQLAMHLKIVGLLEAHLREKSATAIPSALYPQESNFAAMVSKYNETQLALTRALASLAPGHPEVQSMEKQIGVLRTSLADAIEHQKRELTLSIAAIREYGRGFENAITRLPGNQRAFLSQSREQGIQQELYLFLLKKRMETAISRSANIANARVVDAPKASQLPVYPNRQLTLLIALLSGLLTPVGILYIGQIFNNKITSKEDIARQCDVTIIGEISQQRWRQVGSRSLIKEQFRSLRTNVQFVVGTRPNTVILLTSAMAGEGKSFIAMHLAQSLALAGRKVLLIDFDLRKPSLALLLNLRPEGVTEYITSEREPLIQRCANGPPFDFLAAGMPHVDTGELMLSPRVAELIPKLKIGYDYVLLDSPPVGLVADARFLSPYADLTLYIVRQHFTFMHQLTDLHKIREQLPDLHLVLNGTRDLRRYQYHYQ
ncbi:capsular exopolysaccharide family [Dyadobacter soli]|uniref:Capsular exopolysaccharide family n=1 Tax=Dyadobacter soli TaxID=659014 RepID=A0A1G7ZF38_9BACT|nr:polysaccharide biosynthesis tyrosine autokinase [Dyadobacter soli]SDH07146.1 capsular exopolysaccharide family [Dyadobacter soli]